MTYDKTTQANLAHAHLTLFMLETRLWPDEEKTLQETLDILKEYSR